MLLNEIKSIIYLRPLYEMHYIISEARKKTTATTATPDEIELDNLFRPRQHHNIEARPTSRNVEFQRAGREGTRRATSNVRLDPQSAEYLRNIEASGLEDDVVQGDLSRAATPRRRPRPEEPTTLPAKVSKDLSTTSNALAKKVAPEPNWHKIEDLPGYMKSAIRAIGRRVFAPLTHTDIEDIDIIANVNNSGPNSDSELKTVGAYLKKYGQRNFEGEMDFNQNVLPGYTADIKIWTAGDRDYLTVKDHAGQYIYSWPADEGKSFGIPTDQPKLR